MLNVEKVLNLIITGIPSIHYNERQGRKIK